jgi:flagellum-specific peptidoglycan hydrolase FlgJ
VRTGQWWFITATTPGGGPARQRLSGGHFSGQMPPMRQSLGQRLGPSVAPVGASSVGAWAPSPQAFLAQPSAQSVAFQGAVSDNLSGGSTREVFQKAVQLARSLGAPFPELVAAQFALESGYGKHMSGKNNPFGQKASAREAGTVRGTQEYGSGGAYSTSSKFKDYASIAQAFQEHIKRWHMDLRASTPRQAAQEVLSKGYATDPAYVSKLVKIMQDNGAAVDQPRRA